MGLQAARRSSHAGGGWRLFVLAKALDTTGKGWIYRDDLRAYVKRLGASPRMWQRWIAQARDRGLVCDIQTSSGTWRLILPSAGAAGYALGCADIGNRRASMAAAQLIGKGWKARVFAAYEVLFNGRPITRERMQKIVNVPVRTQRYRDRQAGVNRQRNFAKSQQAADHAQGLRDYSDHRGVFATRDKRIAWRLPDIRTFTLAQRGAKGRARKANATISRLRNDGLSQMRQPLSQTPARPFVRLFHYTAATTRAAIRKLSRLDLRVREVYQLAGTASTGAQLWTPYTGAI